MVKQDIDSIAGRLLIAQSKVADIPESGNQEARQAVVRGLEGALSTLLVYAKGNEDQRALLSRAHDCLDLGESLKELVNLEDWFPILVDIVACGLSLHRVNTGNAGIPADCEHMATSFLQQAFLRKWGN